MTESIGVNGPEQTEQAGVSGYARAVIVAGAVQAAVGITTTFYPALADKTTAVFDISGMVLTLTHVMVFVGVIGLAMSGAGGSGWPARIGFPVALVGLGALALGEAVLRVNFDLGNVFFGIAVPAAGLGMVVVGIAILLARRWTGWHRLIALACGLYVPVVLIPAFAIAGGPSFPALAGFGACYLLLGIAMQAEPRIYSSPPQPRPLV